MRDLNFPIHFRFKVTSLANDFTATDANGQVIAYVRQKMFKLKEDITVYADESKAKTLFTIKADRWLDFSAAYSFMDATGKEFGKIARKGWRSIWKAEYEIIDQHDQLQYRISEENGWVKVLDSLFGEIPILGMFTGYLFNPSYLLVDKRDQIVARLKKQPSLLGREFEIEQVMGMDADDEERIMLGFMMMILLERRRG